METHYRRTLRGGQNGLKKWLWNPGRFRGEGDPEL